MNKEQLMNQEMAKTSIYSSWDDSKTAEYTATAERMLKKFNPWHKDNAVPCADYRPSMVNSQEYYEDTMMEYDSTDVQYDQYQYNLWVEQEGSE